VINHYRNFIVTANVDANRDKHGLPAPLALAFYFTASSDLIVQLIILRNRHDIWESNAAVATVISNDLINGYTYSCSSFRTRWVAQDAGSSSTIKHYFTTLN
jgi:hypothetical protein